MAALGFYIVMFLGGAADIIATTFGLSVNAVLWSFRFAALGVPPVVGYVTYRLCVELSRRDGLPLRSRVTFGQITGRLRRGTP